MLILVLLAFQAYRAFRLKAFSFVALGWIFNLCYLLVHNHYSILARKCGISAETARGFEIPLVFVSSGFFWLAARFSKSSGHVFLRRLTDHAIIALVAGSMLWVEIFYVLLPQHYPYFLVAALPDVLVDLYALLALAIFFRDLDEHESSGAGFIRGNRTLFIALTTYAMIQPLHFFTVDLSEKALRVVAALGFFLGLAAKVFAIFGFLDVFSSAATRAREQEASAIAARKTVGRIAHELGTPVGQMIVQVSLMLKEPSLKGRLSQYAANLQFALYRIEAIMEASNALHLFEQAAHSASDNISYKRQEAVVQEVVTSVNTLLQTAIMAVKETRDENVRFDIRYYGNCCVRCVPFELIQIFINLLRNSFDAFPQGNGRLLVETINRASSAGDHKDIVEVTIQDNGHGISSELEKVIFQEGITTRGGPGRGYGLYLSKGLTEKNGGTIRLSQAGVAGSNKGARFIIEFPRVPC
ncbi:MAG TPA: HAMP domain-containing sensor histidine kinase, partial [Thermoanaerobaculia bacterium]|nr:HAMP domain-containing sensor histidine kinase [Thermoanaerobaculia bacterium]